MKVYISSILPGSKEYLFDDAGIKYLQNDSNLPLTPVFCSERLTEYQGIVSLLSEKIDNEIIDSLPNLKIIANYAVGYNNIDFSYAKSKNIIVTNTPGVLTEATAELAVTLSLACSRRFYEGELLVRESKFEGWKPQLLLAHGITGKTIGLVGSGRIARAAAKMFSGFSTKIIYFSRSRSSEMENLFNAEYKPLDELLSLSDVISLHIPLTYETRNLLNREKLELLKPEAIVINLSLIHI
ncbi:MAG: D-glycerate dehydrogenase [Ignavibacteriaceae bacterium]|nr:D-glycerate dehydrogenase [Ignavibacteriaceae bacterium]